MCGKEPYGGLLGSTSICCDQETKVMKETKVTKETKVKKETTVTKETKVMKFDWIIRPKVSILASNT